MAQTSKKVNKENLFFLSNYEKEKDLENKQSELWTEWHKEKRINNARNLADDLVDLKELINEYEQVNKTPFELKFRGQYATKYISHTYCDIFWGDRDNFGTTKGDKAILSEDKLKKISLVVESDDQLHICLNSNDTRYKKWLRENKSSEDIEGKYAEMIEYKDCQPFDEAFLSYIYAKERAEKEIIMVEDSEMFPWLSVKDFEMLISECSGAFIEFSKELAFKEEWTRKDLKRLDKDIAERKKEIAELKGKISF